MTTTTSSTSTTPTAFLITSTEGAKAVAHPLTLATMQASVGGYIEPAFTVPSPIRGRRYAITGYVNEEGLLIGLPVTVATPDGTYAGDMLVCGLDQRTGDTVALTADELAYVARRCRLLAALGASGRPTVSVYGLDLRG